MPLIYFLTFYLPLEEFILKWLPIGEHAYLLLRQLPDIIIVILLLLLVFRKDSNGNRIPIIGNRIDGLLFAFILWVVVVTLFSNIDILIALVKIKAQVRYIVIIYAVLILNPSHMQVEKTLQWLYLAVLLQVMIGISQLVGGIAMRDFLAARHVDANIAGMTIAFTGDRFEDVNDLMGTMGNTIGFGMFLLVGLSLWVVSRRTYGKWYWLGTTVLIVLMYLTGSRSVVLASIILVFAHYWMVRGPREVSLRLILMSPLVLLLGVAAPFAIDVISDTASGNNDFIYMFTPGYIEMALNQRLGILFYIVPELLLSPQALVGVGPDKLTLVNFIFEHFFTVPSILLAVLPYVIEDVYWVALIGYYGLIGFCLWVLFLLRTWKKIASIRRYVQSHTLTRVSTIALLLLLISVPLNFFNQAFSVRGFSFYLWLMCGLALALYRREKRKINGDNRVESNSLS